MSLTGLLVRNVSRPPCPLPPRGAEWHRVAQDRQQGEQSLGRHHPIADLDSPLNEMKPNQLRLSLQRSAPEPDQHPNQAQDPTVVDP
jgi:hypothetical protein